MKNIIFWSMASHGAGISGGDRIFIEFAKRWSEKLRVTIVTWQEGEAMMHRNGLGERSQIKFHRLSIPKIVRSNFLVCYFYRIFAGLLGALFLHIESPESTVLYTSSEFWMDVFPSVVLKLRYPQMRWATTWYQTAPSPLTGFSSGARTHVYRLNAMLLWAAQMLAKPGIVTLADVILVNNDLEKKVFPSKNTIVVLGAVNISQIDAYRNHHKNTPKYAAVFQGRFHPQKGVVELVDIWELVVREHKNAKLAMIGDGQLMVEVKEKIQRLHLDKNIDLLGFLFDGEKKYKIFAQSKLVVHPAFFDSGGMASAEAMAFGIPAVGFNLPAFASYYPVGMVKVPVDDTAAFAQAILDLLSDSNKRNSLGKQGEEFIRESYSWENRSEQILRQIVGRKD